MASVKGKGPIVDPGLCRCCGALKKCRLLNVEYTWQHRKEIYSEMFVDCFGLLLSHLEGEVAERLICATCVTRLRDASLFRQQVLQCEQKLLASYIQLHEGEKNNHIKPENCVKEEIEDMDVDEMANYGVISDNEIEDLERISNGSISKNMECFKPQMEVNSTEVLFDYFKSGNIIVNGKDNKKRVVQKLVGKTDPPDKQKMVQVNSVKDKTLTNAITIVENSYVCPFTTFFNNYYCIYCRHKFVDPDKLRAHVLTHDPKTYKDAITSATRRGNKKCLIDIQRIDCRLCDQKICDIDTLKKHLNSIHAIKLFKNTTMDDVIVLKFRLNANLKCTECDKCFANFHSLKQHMAEHFGACVCEICGAHYFEERMLVAHLKSHKPSKEIFPCIQCGKTFKCKYNLTIHVARLHTKEAAYLCIKCDETFFSDTLRRRHMIQVHNEEYTFKCKSCDKVYDNKRTLGDHNRRIHLKVMKHQCSVCEKRFFLPCRLKEHMASHTGERNFRCEHCGKSYPRLRALKVHVQSHSAEKKFKCSMCNASYSQNVCLKNHMKRQHQGGDVDENY